MIYVFNSIFNSWFLIHRHNNVGCLEGTIYLFIIIYNVTFKMYKMDFRMF